MIALARMLTLLAVLGFAVAAFDPVVTVFGARPDQSPITVELGADAAVGALAGAARAGSRAVDLALRLRSEPSAPATVPAGALGSQVVSATLPLPFDPAALQVRVLRRPTVGRPVALALTCAAADVELAATVVVRAGDAVWFRDTVRLVAGEPAEIEFVPSLAGPAHVQVVVEVGGQTVVRAGDFAVVDPARVLVLEPSGVAAAALQAQGVIVERAGAMTTDLSRYAAAVVGAPLIAPLQDALVAAIEDGLGAFVLAPAFGSAGEPLYDLLPVVPELQRDGEGSGGDTAESGERRDVPPADPTKPPAGEIRDPSAVSPDTVEVDKRTIAMVLVVDRSGSMGSLVAGGRSKMSYAKTSALESARALADGDQVGIVTFGNKGAGRVELPLTDAKETAPIRAGVDRLAHGPEYTYLLAGLQRANELLRPADTAVKHVVVITDGEFDTSETVALRALAFRMFREAKISVTILSIVSSQTQPGFKRDAELITRDGGGEFFALAAAETVPVFVSAEVTRSLDRAGRRPGGGPAVDSPTPPEPEPPEPEPTPEPAPADTRVPVRAVANSPVLEPRPVEWPSLGGAVATTAPLDAQVLLVAGDQGWPLLCYGNRGLGRIGAFAADLCGDAGSELRAEAAFPARLALWVQHVMRAEPSGEPQAVALTTAIAPGAPTPVEIAALERLGGTPLQAEIAPAAGAVSRTVRSLLPSWALAAVGLLLLLVFVERLAVLRGRA